MTPSNIDALLIAVINAKKIVKDLDNRLLEIESFLIEIENDKKRR